MATKTSALKREADRAVRGLLTAERASTARINAALRDAYLTAYDVLDRARSNNDAMAATRAAAANLESAMRAAVNKARLDARAIANVRAGAQLDAVAKIYGVAIKAPLIGPSPIDASAAETAASSYRSAWQSDVAARLVRWTRESGSAATLARQATQTQAYRVDRIATTEAATAYNDEQRRVVEAAAGDGGSWTTVTFRRWDARLDARVCQRCADHDGEEVPLDSSFSGDSEPGAVHPRCRCVAVIVTFPDRMAIDERTEAKRREWVNPKTGKPFRA